MKKLMTMILAAMLSLPVFSQYGPVYDQNTPEHYFGLRLGLNTASVNSGDVAMDYTTRAGLSLGFICGIQLSSTTPVWLETGFSYSEKGGNMSERHSNIKMRLTYLELPIVCKYSFAVGDDCFVLPFVGGYLAMGVAGKMKDYANRIVYKSYDTFERFDGGLRFGCGAEYQQLYVEVGMEVGLADISKDDFASARNQNFFFNVGVNF